MELSVCPKSHHRPGEEVRQKYGYFRVKCKRKVARFWWYLVVKIKYTIFLVGCWCREPVSWQRHPLEWLAYNTQQSKISLSKHPWWRGNYTYLRISSSSFESFFFFFPKYKLSYSLVSLYLVFKYLVLYIYSLSQRNSSGSVSNENSL